MLEEYEIRLEHLDIKSANNISHGSVKFVFKRRIEYHLTERPDSSPHWPEMAVWPCYVQISSDDLFSSTNHLGNPFLNIYLMEQLKLPMSIFL